MNKVVLLSHQIYGAIFSEKRWSLKVRPILEYGSVVWNPNYQIHSDKLESVQKQFLLFALAHFRWDSRVSLPSYTSRLKLINLPTLSSRREMLGIIFLMKILNGTVCSSFLLSEIKFNIPIRFCANQYKLNNIYLLIF